MTTTIEELKAELARQAKLIEGYNEEIQFFNTVLAHIPANIYWKDRHGIYLGANENLARILQLRSRQEIIGKTDYDWLPKELAAQICENDQFVMQNNTSLKREEIALNLEGQPATYISEKIPLHNADGTVSGLLGISFDISKRVEYEGEVMHAKELAEVASRAKTEFIMNMSHDIRTPCTGIVGYTKLLIEQETDAKKRLQLATINQSAEKLLSFLTKVIDLSRIEDNDLPRQNIVFNIRDLITEAQGLFAALIQDKQISLTVHIDPKHPEYLYGNQYAFYRILLNLLSNAIKFTHQGGITLTLSQVTCSEKQVMSRLSIADTGIGITPENLAVIFDKFTRLSQSNKGIYEGTGIGLYISKKFLDELGGTIRVESSENQGSTFTCELPFDICEASVTPQQREVHCESLHQWSLQRPSFGEKYQILLVEDNPLAQRIAKTLLEDHGCEVTVASNGEQALASSARPFDLIFMDIGLPDMDGVEVVRRLRSSSEMNANTVIVGLTAHIEREFHEQLLSAGVNDVVTKPIDKHHIHALFKV